MSLELREYISDYESQQGAVIPFPQRIQEKLDYLSQNAISGIVEAPKMSSFPIRFHHSEDTAMTFSKLKSPVNEVM